MNKIYCMETTLKLEIRFFCSKIKHKTIFYKLKKTILMDP